MFSPLALALCRCHAPALFVFPYLVAVSDAGRYEIENRESPQVQEGAFDIGNRCPLGIHADKTFNAPGRGYQAAQDLPYGWHAVIGPGNAADEEENHRREDDDEEDAFPFAYKYRQGHAEEYRGEQERCHEGIYLPLVAQLRVVEKPRYDVQHIHGRDDVEAVIANGFSQNEVQYVVADFLTRLVIVPQLAVLVKSAGKHADAEYEALLYDDDEESRNHKRGKSSRGIVERERERRYGVGYHVDLCRRGAGEGAALQFPSHVERYIGEGNQEILVVEQQAHVGVENDGTLFAPGQFLVEVGRNFQNAEAVALVHELFGFVEVGAVGEDFGVG